MAVNYEYVKEPDGTYTIRDVEIAAAGRWKPANWQGTAFDMSDDKLAAMVNADAEIRAKTTLQPVIRNLHAPDVIGGTHQSGWIGALGPLRKIGDKLLADLRGLAEAAFEYIVSGKAGRISPDISIDWEVPNSEDKLPIVLTGVSFTGPAFPAIATLKPIASFSGAIESNGESMTLLSIDAAPVQQAAFAKTKTEDDGMDQKELDRLRDELAAEKASHDQAVAAFQSAQAAEKDAIEKERMALRQARVDALIEANMAKILPAQVEQVKQLAMSMTDDHLTVYFDQIKAGPDVETKKTDKGIPTPSGKPNEASFQQQAWDIASDYLKDNPAESMGTAMAFAEKQLGTDKAMLWFGDAFPEDKRDVRPNRLEVG